MSARQARNALMSRTLTAAMVGFLVIATGVPTAQSSASIIRGQALGPGSHGMPVAQAIAIPGKAIDVGQTINSVTRMFESGPVSFSGRFITDSFARMGVHVYVVQ